MLDVSLIPYQKASVIHLSVLKNLVATDDIVMVNIENLKSHMHNI